jgi:predicted NBD/HSP70 family sugar kinase
VVRRSDGFVSMAPNLGWRDVPLGEALAAALDFDAPIQVANDADLGALVEVRRGAAIGGDHVLFISGEYGVGGGAHRRRPAADRCGRLRRRGRPPHGQSQRRGLRCGSIGCWETEVGEGALLRMAGGHRVADGRDRRVAAGRRERRAIRPERPRSRRALARHRPGRPRQRLQPALIVLGGIFGRILPYVGRTLEDELDRRALAAPRRLVRIVPGTLREDAPLLGAAELAFEPLLVDPAGWLVPDGAAWSRRVHDIGPLPEPVRSPRAAAGSPHGAGRFAAKEGW